MSIFLKGEAIIQVQTQQQLINHLKRLLENPEECALMGSKAKQIVNEYQGATSKTMDVIANYLQ